MEGNDVIEMALDPDIEVFSSTEAVVSDSFLTALPEDKLSFFDHICTMAQVNIICNTKGNFTAQGSWKRIIALEDILKNALKDSNRQFGSKMQPSANSYFFNDVSTNLSQSHSEQKQYFDERTKEKACLKSAQEKSDIIELCTSAIDTTILKEEAPTLTYRSDSIEPTNSSKESVVKIGNENEIYVNITLATCGDQTVDSGVSTSDSNVPCVDSTISSKKLNPLRNKGECENAPHSNKLTSEKDKRKIYEQQAPFKFFCNFCSFKSKRESHYKKHIQLHKQDSTKLHICSQCGFRTIRMGHLRRHKLQHAPEALSCTLCSYTTDNSFFLQRHHRLKHSASSKGQTSDEPEYLHCSHCSYKTIQPHFLKRHLRVHKVGEAKRKSTLYQCEKCNYKTLRKEHIERHKRDVHSEVRPFLCDTCGKAFKRADALRQHRASRHRPSLTPGKDTTAPGSVTSASLLHCCPQCSKPCRSKAHLKDHMATHSDERSFLCEICGSSFKTRAVQRKHVATIHANPKAFPCNHCVRRFSTKYALLRHKKIHGPTKDDSATPEEIRASESRLLNYAGICPKMDQVGALSQDVSEAETPSKPDSYSKKGIPCENERTKVVEEMQKKLPSSSVGTESNDVPHPRNEQECSESKGCAVVIGLDGEMQSVNGGILTRTPAPSETTTALLYLTTDLTHYR